MQELKTQSLIIEVTEPIIKLLDSLVETGLFGPTKETAAQRLLEQKIFEMSTNFNAKKSV